MSSSYITISYFMFFYLISSADLFSILFYSTLFQIDWIGFDSIRLNTILLNSICYIVQYCISYPWMICVCLSIRPSVCLSVCLFICMNNFSPCFLLFLSLFSLLFSHERLPYTHTRTRTWTHTRTRTHKYIWIYVPSYDSYILLQKTVSEESYSSDCIISHSI